MVGALVNYEPKSAPKETRALGASPRGGVQKTSRSF